MTYHVYEQEPRNLSCNIQRLLRVSRNLSASADFPATLLSLNTAPKADFLVQDELPDDLDPAVVAGQVAVELVGNLVELPQTRPGDGGEVVVLVVQTHVVREQVQPAVVGEGLWRRGCLGFLALFLVLLLLRAGVLGEHVVLGDEVAGNWVQRACEERAQDEVSNGLASDVLNDQVVEDELYGDVEGVNAGQRQVVDEHGSQGIEEDLEGSEERFAGDGIEEPSLKGCWQVGV